MLKKIRKNIYKKTVKRKIKAYIKNFIEFTSDNEEFICYIQNINKINKETELSFKQPPSPNKDLKVAVCISGFLRTYKTTANAFKKNIIDRYNADVFVYSPNLGGASKDWSKSVEDIDKSDKISTEDIYNTYGENNVKGCNLWDYDVSLFEKQINENNIPNLKSYNPSRILSAFYQIKECNKLKIEYEKENNFKYDVVIKTRGDLGTYSPLNLEMLDSLSDTFYHVKGGDFSKKGTQNKRAFYADSYRNIERGECMKFQEFALNDFINIASSENMDRIAEIYDNVIEYCERGVVPHPETLLIYHAVIENKLNLKMEDFITCEIFRENSQKKWNPHYSS